MVALDSAERAARALLRFPVVFVGAAAFAVLKVPVEATRPLRVSLDVYAVLALLTFLFTPVLLAGLYGVAASALEGRGLLAEFWIGIGEGYVDLLLANVLYASVQHLLMLAFTVLVVAAFVLVGGGVGMLAEVASDPAQAERIRTAAGALGLAAVVVVSVAYLLVRFAVAFLAQLYKPATVVGDAGPVEAFVLSQHLVRENLESALAFVVVRGFVMVVLLLPGVVAAVALVVAEGAVLQELQSAPGGVVVAALLAVAFAVGVVEFAFLATYRVAFYESLVRDDAGA